MDSPGPRRRPATAQGGSGRRAQVPAEVRVLRNKKPVSSSELPLPRALAQHHPQTRIVGALGWS